MVLLCDNNQMEHQNQMQLKKEHGTTVLQYISTSFYQVYKNGHPNRSKTKESISSTPPQNSSIGTSGRWVKSRSAPAVLPNPKLHLASYRPTNESETFSAQCTPKYTTERIPVLPMVPFRSQFNRRLLALIRKRRLTVPFHLLNTSYEHPRCSARSCRYHCTSNRTRLRRCSLPELSIRNLW